MCVCLFWSGVTFDLPPPPPPSSYFAAPPLSSLSLSLSVPVTLYVASWAPPPLILIGNRERTGVPACVRACVTGGLAKRSDRALRFFRQHGRGRDRRVGICQKRPGRRRRRRRRKGKRQRGRGRPPGVSVGVGRRHDDRPKEEQGQGMERKMYEEGGGGKRRGGIYLNTERTLGEKSTVYLTSPKIHTEP